MGHTKQILVVEDEADFAELICYNLNQEGFATQWAGDGRGAMDALRDRVPDLIILDRMLPQASGDEVIAALKRDARTRAVPVIMLTAKGEETDELVGLALGADDYVKKPCSMKLLLARVGAVLRRAEGAVQEAEVLSAGPIVLDHSRHEVKVDGHATKLTVTEFRLLEALMNARERVLTRSQLIDTVLGPMVAVTDRTVDVHIAGLRKKLGGASQWVRTVRGVGYTFRAPD